MVKFIMNELLETTLVLGAIFAFCSHGETLLRQGALPIIEQRVTDLFIYLFKILKTIYKQSHTTKVCVEGKKLKIHVK